MLSRSFNVQPPVILSGKVNCELDIIDRRCIDNVNRISQTTSRRRCVRQTGVVVHIVPRRADGIVLVEGEGTPQTHDIGAGFVGAHVGGVAG